jgi:hypothetical protein
MTTTYGVLPTGFLRKPQSVILSEIEADQLAGISSDWDVSPESPVGQVNAAVARQLSLVWELGETVYNSNDPDKAEDALLTAVAKLTGTERQAADYSTVTLTFNLTSGTLLESGTHFVQDETDPSSRWTPVADYTGRTGGGSQSTTFRAENTGPVLASAGVLTIISTPVVGWDTPNNFLGAIPGRNLEEDPELRIDRERQIANAAGASIDGIKAALERLLLAKGVAGGTVLANENATATADSNGLPPNSFEMVVWDGTTDGSAVLASDIATTIWGHKGSGARSYGSLSGTTLDASGTIQTVYFSRSEVLPIYLEFDMDVDDDFDAAAFKLALATAANAAFGGGMPVRWAKLTELAMEQANVIDFTAPVKLGLTPSPTLSVNIPVTVRQIARFDTSRITVVAT